MFSNRRIPSTCVLHISKDPSYNLLNHLDSTSTLLPSFRLSDLPIVLITILKLSIVSSCNKIFLKHDHLFSAHVTARNL